MPPVARPVKDPMLEPGLRPTYVLLPRDRGTGRQHRPPLLSL